MILSQYKNILMLGEGATGHSVVSAFKEKGRQIDVISAESELEWCELSDLVDRKKVDLIVVSPGIPINDKLSQIRASGVRVSSDVEIFCQLCDLPIIAITGTNGKTTTAHWLSRVLQHYGNPVVVGNSGVPVFDVINKLGQYDWIIMELSSFQLHKSEHLPIDIACILNLDQDHLDWHPTLEHYHQSKWRICKDAKSIVVHESLNQGTNFIQFGLVTDNVLINQVCDDENWSCVTAMDKLNSLAVHHITQVLGVPVDLQFVLNNAPRLRHRMEFVHEGDNWIWINDSKATNFAAARSCLESVRQTYPDHKIVWIVGGVFKEAVPRKLTALADTILSYGQDGALVSDNHFTQLSDLLEELYHIWLDRGEERHVVCFSPGGASFDQFKNYRDRGDFFTQWIMRVSENDKV